MRMFKLTLLSVAWAVALTAAQGASFINLDFESANTNTRQIEWSYSFWPWPPGLAPFGKGQVDQLLPGWTVISRGTLTNVAFIGNGFFDPAKPPPSPKGTPGHAGLMIPGKYVIPHVIAQPDGNYGLLFDGAFASVRVIQTGDVPLKARWLQFKMLTWYHPMVIVDGQVYGGFFLNADAIIVDANRIAYLDISPWAGKTVSLAFGEPGDAIYGIDSIRFLAANELEPIHLQVTSDRGDLIISWNGPGKLTECSTIDGIFKSIPTASNPYRIIPVATRFYRVEQ